MMMTLQIIQDILSILDEMNETIDSMAKYPMSGTGHRAEKIRKIRTEVRKLEPEVLRRGKINIGPG